MRIAAGWRTSKHKRHVVTEVVSPFGKRVEEREGRRLLGVQELVEGREREMMERRRRRGKLVEVGEEGKGDDKAREGRDGVGDGAVMTERL